jgi:hypothetical protein
MVQRPPVSTARPAIGRPRDARGGTAEGRAVDTGGRCSTARLPAATATNEEMAATRRRLTGVHAHLRCSPSPSAAAAARDESPAPILLDDAAMKEFIKTGFVLLAPDAAGMPPLDVHQQNWTDGCALQEDADAGVHSVGDNIVASIPGVSTVLEAPAVRGVLQSVLGEGYTYHPHHFMHMTSPQTDQFWHKDSGRPWGGRKMRHHQSIEAMLLYYPQDTTEDLGPTVLLPGTPYWEDGPKPPKEGMGAATTPDEKDSIFRSSFERLGWPEETAPHKVVVPAGSVAIVHFDIYHRGSRRLESADDEGRKRLMYKFWLSRTVDPTSPSWDHTPQPDDDCPEAFGGGNAPGRLGAVWTHAWNWLRGAPAGRRAIDPAALQQQQQQRGRELSSVAELQAELLGDSEPERIAASYELAALAPTDPAALAALHHSLIGDAGGDGDGEGGEARGDGGDNNAKMELGLAARRAATFGLVSLGPLATSAFLDATAASRPSEVRTSPSLSDFPLAY